MHFGENQLSRRSMSFSLLNTGHRKVLQHQPVRSSSIVSHTFNLPMLSSRRFGSINDNYVRPIQTRFRYGSDYYCLNLATINNSLTHSTIGTWSPGGSHSIVSNKFQDLFHSPIRGSFHRSLTVLCAIGVKKYLALPSGLGGFMPDFSCLTLLRCRIKWYYVFRYGTLTPYGIPSKHFS